MRRIPALDGLRGVAILLVVAAHTGVFPDVAGKNGVAVFFVLSGYLITRVLLRDEHPSLREFYKRRARRLLPALLLIVTVGWAFGWVSGLDMLWPLTYTTNFALAAGYGHYVLSHTWTLAIEEHFYLIWPVVLGWMGRRWRTMILLLVASTMWAVYATMTANSVLAFQWSTDSHAFMLLLGCAAALGRYHGVVPNVSATTGSVALFGVVAVSLIDLPISVGFDRGLAVKALPAVLATVVVCADRLPALEGKLLGWFGTISYGLYLWHGALFSAYPNVTVGWLLAAALLAASGSWYLVERPILRGLQDRPVVERLELPVGHRPVPPCEV